VRSESVICVAAKTRDVYTQTFVRAHIQLLPATVKELYIEELSLDRAGTLKEFLQENRVDAVLAEFGDTGVYLMEACRSTDLPLVVRFGGMDAYCELPKWHVLRQLYPSLFKVSAAIIAVSHDMERQLERLGAPTEKLHYCPSGANTSVFYGAMPSSAPPVFVAVGRLVYKKAPYLTLMAFSKVLRACPEAKLVIIGTGYLMEVCQRLAKALQVDHAVGFMGGCSHEQVAAWMRAARCFVQHSVRAADGDSEGTPNSVIEAAATGLPIVATRHAGIPDVVVHGQTGFLVDEGDVDGMAGNMLRLALEPGTAAQLGDRARKRANAEFTLEKSICRLWEIISAAIATAPRTKHNSFLAPTGPTR
jgi:colanic acid/amylovoran biosynthesis glycosyltransferase